MNVSILEVRFLRCAVAHVSYLFFQCQVTASHIVVNQLIDDYLTSNEMEKVARILKTCGRGGYEGMIFIV